MTDKIITLKNIKKSYSGNTVLSDLDLVINNNSVTSVIGPNGSGKTTLFKLILGITDCNEGDIEKSLNYSFGFMLDDCRPFDRLTLVQNMIAFSGLSQNKITRKNINEIISITFCEKIKSKPFKSLSAGQQKKALFALSLLNDPKILILDEPLNSLDLKERIDIISTIRFLKEAKGKTIIISSHDLASLYELCDIFNFLKDGRICNTAYKSELSPDKLNELYLEIYK